MSETVTVDTAISRGRLMVLYPARIIVLIGIAAIAYSTYLTFTEVVPAEYIFYALVLTILLPIVYQLLMAPQWRLWAFENVNNVHELKEVAVHERIISNDDSFWTKYEVRTASFNQRWSDIQHRFEKGDTYEEEFTAPSETFIYYSKSKTKVGIVFMSIFILSLVYALYESITNWQLFAVLIIGVSLVALGYFMRSMLKQLNNTTPQIIISDKGIQTVITDFTIDPNPNKFIKMAAAVEKTEFYGWQDISDADVITVIERGGETQSQVHYLVYQHPNGNVKRQIDDLDIDWRTLDRLIVAYRNRYNKSARYQ